MKIAEKGFRINGIVRVTCRSDTALLFESLLSQNFFLNGGRKSGQKFGAYIGHGDHFYDVGRCSARWTKSLQSGRYSNLVVKVGLRFSSKIELNLPSTVKKNILELLKFDNKI